MVFTTIIGTVCLSAVCLIPSDSLGLQPALLLFDKRWKGAPIWFNDIKNDGVHEILIGGTVFVEAVIDSNILLCF